MFTLPQIRNEINPKDVHINGTPDGNYALRILEYYRLRCNERWITESLTEVERSIFDTMNKTQEQRAKELDIAIAKLKEK